MLALTSNKIRFSFPNQILLFVGITMIISIYPMMVYLPGKIMVGVFLGCLISILNVLAGYFIITHSIRKPNKEFMKMFLGGILGRFFFVGIVIVILIKIFYIDTMGFLISLFFYYFIFLFLEVNYLNKKLIRTV